MTKINISEDLLIVKDLIGKPRKSFNEEIEVNCQLKELGYKVEEIKKKIEGKSNFDLKKLKSVTFLLNDKEMTSSEVGIVLKISRNRANEYLKKMEKDKLLGSRFVGKKKYYTAIKHD